MKYLKSSVWLAVVLIIIVCILSVTGLFNFGFGLGNVVFIITIIVITILYIIFTKIALKQNSKTLYILLIIASTLICCYYSYMATLGRGAEFKWNGEIFYLK